MGKLIQNQTHYKSEVLLKTLSYVELQDFAASLILNTRHGYFKNNVIMPHNTNEQGLKHAGSDSRLLFLSCSVFSVHTKYSAFVETKWFDYRKQRLWSCPYPHSTTCKYQISLNCIVRMLYLKIIIWVASLSFIWNRSMNFGLGLAKNSQQFLK